MRGWGGVRGVGGGGGEVVEGDRRMEGEGETGGWKGRERQEMEKEGMG